MGVACDIRVCTKDARMCVKEVDIGLAADIGTLTRLPKMGVSYSWVKDVCLTAREFGSEEALRVGFVSNVFEDKAQGMEGALGICKLIAEKSPVAVFGTKEILNFSRDRSIEDGRSFCSFNHEDDYGNTDDSRSEVYRHLEREHGTIRRRQICSTFGYAEEEAKVRKIIVCESNSRTISNASFQQDIIFHHEHVVKTIFTSSDLSFLSSHWT